MREKDPKSNISSTTDGSRSSRSRTDRIVVVGRVAHRRGPSRRRAVRVVVVGRVAHRRGPARRRTVRVVVVGRVAHRRGPACRRAVGVVEVGRVAHTVGRPGRRAVGVAVVRPVPHCRGRPHRRTICASVLRPLRLRHARTSEDDEGCQDSDCRFLFHFAFLFRVPILSRTLPLELNPSFFRISLLQSSYLSCAVLLNQCPLLENTQIPFVGGGAT